MNDLRIDILEIVNMLDLPTSRIPIGICLSTTSVYLHSAISCIVINLYIKHNNTIYIHSYQSSSPLPPSTFTVFDKSSRSISLNFN